MDIQFRQIMPHDCRTLAQLDRDVFSQPLSEQGFLNEIRNKNSYTLLALHNGEIIGYSNFWGVCGEITLNNIAICESYRGNGIGNHLLEISLETLENRFGECEFVTLEVRKSNRTAISLYQKHGFEVIGERVDFYQLPTENALLMMKR